MDALRNRALGKQVKSHHAHRSRHRKHRIMPHGRRISAAEQVERRRADKKRRLDMKMIGELQKRALGKGKLKPAHAAGSQSPAPTLTLSSGRNNRISKLKRRVKKIEHLISAESDRLYAANKKLQKAMQNSAHNASTCVLTEDPTAEPTAPPSEVPAARLLLSVCCSP